MDIYRRYFRVTSGPMVDHMTEAAKINDAANEKYKAILDEVGAKRTYYHQGRRMTAMMFDGEPDRNIFKKCGQGWWPKKNGPTGKDLNKRLSAIETKDPNDALKLVGLRYSPCVFAGGKCYWPTLIVIPGDIPTIYVTLPWFDCDSAEVEQYKRDREAGIRGDANLDHIMWTPSAEMEEVKGWQVDKHIDEYNESIKAERR